MLLAGDIGGTKTDLAVFTPEAGPRSPIAQKEFRSADYPGLAEMVRDFLAEVRQPITRACFDVAGPVMDGRAKLTNLPWTLDEQTLARDLQLTAVDLLNDLQAIAYAVPVLQPDDLYTLSEGTASKRGAMAVIAPGTGLGEAFLVWDGSRYRAFPSEGGHADFAPTNADQVGLLQYLQNRLPHVSYESVCSGRGIPNIYAYLQDSGRSLEDPELVRRLAESKDPTPIIVETALAPECRSSLCRAALDMFVSILGAEAGNMALKVMATGGVYLAGGIPIHVLEALKHGQLLDSFRKKGRLSTVLDKMPVHVIMQRAALLGAASYGLLLASEAGSARDQRA